MKEYAIYLKKRIQDAKIFIRCLTYYDSFSVGNKIELVSEIRDLLKTVHEKISSGMEISTDAAFSVRYNSVLEKEKIELKTSDLLIISKPTFSVENTLQIQVSDVNAIEILPSDVCSSMWIRTEPLPSLKTTFGEVDDGLEFQSSAVETQKRVSESVQSAIQIGSTDLNLFYRQTAGAEATKISISASCHADLKRYRLLHDLDDLTLADLDDYTLEELDYVWLT